MVFGTQLVKIDDICHIFFLFSIKIAPLSCFRNYNVPYCFDVTWFQLLCLIFVQSFVSKSFIKIFLYNFSFYKCLPWFYDFLRVSHSSNRGFRDHIRYGHKTLPSYWKLKVIEVIKHQGYQCWTVGIIKASWGSTGLPLRS